MKRLLAAAILLLAVAVFALGASAALQTHQALLGGSATGASSATLTSDQVDYHPGETVTLTGKGWAPNEAVTIVITPIPATHDPVTLTATSDDSGNFTSTGYVVQKSDLGVKFYVTARGATADTSPLLTFTDAIGTPTSIGTGTHTVGQVSSFAVPVTAAVPVNNTVIVTIVFDNNNGPTVSVTDSGGNTYTTNANVANANNTQTLVFSAPVTTALTTSNSITVNFTGATARFIFVSNFQVSGLVVAASPVDKTSTNSNTTGTTAVSSGTTAATTQANELLMGALGIDFANTGTPTLTPGSGYTALTTATVSGQWGMYPEFQIVNATGTYAATGTMSGNTLDWSAAIVTFKGAASKLAFTTAPVNIVAGVCSPQITVQSQDANGNPASPASTETIALSTSPSAGATFFSNNTCTTSITSVTIAAGATSASFFWSDTTAGSPVITATGTGAFSSAPTQTETVTAPTPSTITAVTLGAQTPSPVTANSSATYSVTATWAGGTACASIPLVFNGSLPAGATASFSPTTVSTGSPTSTLTISTTNATPAGTTAGLSVTATSTGGTGTCGTSSVTSATTSLVVQAGRTITANTVGTQTPNPVTSGSSATYSVTTTWAGNGTCTSVPLVFNGSLPTGATASFSPTTVSNTSPTSTLTITTTGATPAGTTSNLSVTATSTGGTGNCGTSSVTSATFSFVVQAPQTITAVTLGAQTPSPVTANSSATYSVTAAWTGTGTCTSIPLVFNGALPTGATASFSPTTVSNSSPTSTLTISTTDATPAGTTNNLSVTATSTGGTGGSCGTSSITSATTSLVVQAGQTITATTVGAQSPNPVNPPNSATFLITTTWAGNGACTSTALVFTGTLPTGANASFNPTTVSNSSPTSTLTITTSATTPGGSTTFAVKATSTAGTGNCGTSSITSSNATFVVAPQTVTAVTVGAQSPSPVIQGSSATYPVTSTWTGGAICTPLVSVNFTGGTPAGVTTGFSPTLTSSAPNPTLTIGTTAATPANTYTYSVTVTSTGGTGNCGTSSITSSNASLVVSAAQVISTVTVGAQTPNPINQGSSATYSITTTWTGNGTCTPSVTVNWTGGTPAGVTTGISPTLTSSQLTSTLTVNTTTATPASSTFTLTVASTGGTGNCGTGTVTSSPASTLTVTQTATISTVTVGAETPGSVGPGQSATYTITTTWTGTGTCTSVPLTITWTPATGETAQFSPTTVANNSTSTTLTISTTASTPTGSTSFTVTVTSTGGTGGCGTGTKTSSPASTFVVATAVIQGVTVGTQSPNPVVQGNSATYSISTTWTGTGLNCVSNPLQMVWTPPSPDTTATFNPATVSSGSTSSTLTITTFSDTPPSTTNFNVEVGNSSGGGCSGSNLVASSGSTLVVSGNAPPSITKAFSPANIAPAATSTLTLTLTALAADVSTLTGVAVSDPLPSGMQVASTPAATNSCGGTFSAAAAATTISLSGGSLAAGATCAVSVSITASTSGTYTNTTGNVTATNVGYAGGNATATLTVYGAPTQLIFGAQISNAGQGQAITPAVTVQVEDAQGNIVTNSTASITINIGNKGTGPGNGYLNGTTTVSAVTGIAVFSNLSINRMGTGYTLVASSSPLTSATSNSFSITQPTATFTETFDGAHGAWAYVQTSCATSFGTLDGCASSASVSGANCFGGSGGCVSADTFGNTIANTQTGYFQLSLTWIQMGVPAGATVQSVSGSWWDSASTNCIGGTTAGMQIYNISGSSGVQITSAAVAANVDASGDAGGVPHSGAGPVTVNTGFQAASATVNLRFNMNQANANVFLTKETCTLYGDNYSLTITYTLPNGGRRGQVIIGFMRMPDGDFQMTKPVLVSSTQDRMEDRVNAANPAILSKRDE